MPNDKYSSYLKKFRERINLGQKELAEILGVGRTSLAYMEQGTREVSDTVKLGLLKTFKYDIDNDEYLEDIKDVKNMNTIKIPFYRISIAAGSGIYLDDNVEKEILYFDKRFLSAVLPLYTDFNWLNCYTAMGDSMTTPDGKGILSGDLLFVDISKKSVNDGVYVININNDLRVKRLIKHLDGSLSIQSDNPKYAPELYNPDTSPFSIEVIGKVIYNMSRRDL